LALLNSPRPNPANRATAGSFFRQQGLTRAELTWILGLSALILGIIFWSWRTDLVQARDRLANQQIAFLVGQIRFALEVDPGHGDQWPQLMAGPGSQPDALQAKNPAQLDSALSAHTYLPQDPWGGAYILQWQEQSKNWLLQCCGPKQNWAIERGQLYLSHPIFPPADA